MQHHQEQDSAPSTASNSVTEEQLKLLLDGSASGATPEQKQSCSEVLQQIAVMENLGADQATWLRIKGAAAAVLRVLASHDDWETHARRNAAAVALLVAEKDSGPATKEMLVKGGVVRILASAANGSDEALLNKCLSLVLECIRGVRPAFRKSMFEEMFRLGVVGQMSKLMVGSGDADAAGSSSSGASGSSSGAPNQDRQRRPATSEVVARIFGWITGAPQFRKRCRDIGLIPPLLLAARSNPDAPFYVSAVTNLAMAEPLHMALKQLDLLGVLQDVISRTTNEVVRTQAVMAIACTYGAQGRGETADRADALLASCHIASSVLQALDACVHGNRQYGGLRWSLPDVLMAIQSLSSREHHARDLVAAGLVSILVELLDSGEAESEVVVLCCTALMRMACVGALVPALQQAGVEAVVQSYAGHEDMRVRDAANSCLLQLMSHAPPDHVSGGGGGAADGVSKDLQKAIALDKSHQQQQHADASQATNHYCVFLSHKRTDAKDFARAIYNLLVLRGIKTFLDYEYREELCELSTIVANTTNFIFIMTDHVFESKWCITELTAAVEANCNIILLVKDGARWKSEDGSECEWPPLNVLQALPEAVQKVFLKKGISHSDEYYNAFVEILLSKVILDPVPLDEAAQEPLGPNAGGNAYHGMYRQQQQQQQQQLHQYQQQQQQQQAAGSPHAGMPMPPPLLPHAGSLTRMAPSDGGAVAAAAAGGRAGGAGGGAGAGWSRSQPPGPTAESSGGGDYGDYEDRDDSNGGYGGSWSEAGPASGKRRAQRAGGAPGAQQRHAPGAPAAGAAAQPLLYPQGSLQAPLHQAAFHGAAAPAPGFPGSGVDAYGGWPAAAYSMGPYLQQQQQQQQQHSMAMMVEVTHAMQRQQQASLAGMQQQMQQLSSQLHEGRLKSGEDSRELGAQVRDLSEQMHRLQTSMMDMRTDMHRLQDLVFALIGQQAAAGGRTFSSTSLPPLGPAGAAAPLPLPLLLHQTSSPRGTSLGTALGYIEHQRHRQQQQQTQQQRPAAAAGAPPLAPLPAAPAKSAAPAPASVSTVAAQQAPELDDIAISSGGSGDEGDIGPWGRSPGSLNPGRAGDASAAESGAGAARGAAGGRVLPPIDGLDGHNAAVLPRVSNVRVRGRGRGGRGA